MEQMERIAYMEKILDEAKTAVTSLSEALEKYAAVVKNLEELEAYYDGEQWRQDFDDDSAGKIPTELKRGFLSEDAVYDLLMDNRELKERLRKFAAQ